jgi:hypothetical protein
MLAATGGREAIHAAGLAVNSRDLTSPTNIREAVSIARKAALSVKSHSESTSWRTGEFTGLPTAIFQNWLYEQNRDWRFTEGTLAVLWCLELPNARCDYAKQHRYVASTRTAYNAGRHQSLPPKIPSVAYDRNGHPVTKKVKRISKTSSEPAPLQSHQTEPSIGPEARSLLVTSDDTALRQSKDVVTSLLNMKHFEALRNKVNIRLEEIGTRHVQEQIHKYPWVYGALGQVPSKVMFICENPSLGGVEKAATRPISGSVLGIEDQWQGKIFRPVLCQFGLKTTGPLEPGGWQCYITNVIKEANYTKNNNVNSPAERRAMARKWADILAWELTQVSPEMLIAVGNWADEHVRDLQDSGLIPDIPTHKVTHYSRRYMKADKVKSQMVDGLIDAGFGQASGQ